MTKNGIMCEENDKKVLLDPKKTDSSGVNFVSHAHMDHLPSKNGVQGSEVSRLRKLVQIVRNGLRDTPAHFYIAIHDYHRYQKLILSTSIQAKQVTMRSPEPHEIEALPVYLEMGNHVVR